MNDAVRAQKSYIHLTFTPTHPYPSHATHYPSHLPPHAISHPHYPILNRIRSSQRTVGRYLERYVEHNGRSADNHIRIHTKFVPDLGLLGKAKEGAEGAEGGGGMVLDLDFVRSVVQRSCNRVGLPRVDMVQFHWWDFAVPGYVGET